MLMLIFLIRPLITSTVDYCCSAFVGISGVHINRLLYVLNAEARLVFAARKSDHVTSYLCDFHWLNVSERIQCFQLCISLAFVIPPRRVYLADSLRRVSDTDTHRRMLTLLCCILSTRRSLLGHRFR